MLTVRELPASDWSRLDGTELASVWRTLSDQTRVLVIEDGDRLVGCWGLLPVWHVEGVWIHPDYRQTGSVARRLLAGMRALLRSIGISGVVTAAASEDVAGYLGRLGATPLPPSFVWRVT